VDWLALLLGQFCTFKNWFVHVILSKTTYLFWDEFVRLVYSCLPGSTAFCILIHSHEDFVECAVNGINSSILSNKAINCSLPSLDILGLYPDLPYCRDRKSIQNIFHYVMEILSELTTQPQNFGCR